MSKNIIVPKEVVEKFNKVNLQHKENGRELLKYVAMDCDNEWYGYCKKPTGRKGFWSSNHDRKFLCITEKNWENSLTEMPLEDI